MCAKLYEEENSQDAFLGGRLRLMQPYNGFRSGVDSVLLAASIDAKPGNIVLDLGSGVGTVLLCLMTRVSKLQGFGIEIQEESYSLALKNAEINKLEAKFFLGDFKANSKDINQKQFDHIFFNPPYYKEQAYKKSNNNNKNISNMEKENVLEGMLKFSLKRCKPFGQITLINRPARLGAILSILETKAGDIKILPIVSSNCGSALRVIVTAKKSAKGDTKLLNSLQLFNESKELGKHFSLQVQEILAGAKSLKL